MIKFKLPVRPATKKNSGQIIQIKGRSILIPSKQYKQFEKDCLPFFKRIKSVTGQINYPVNIKCIFFMETKRRVDLPNLLNAIDDAMVYSGLLLDDNRDIIAAHDGSRVFHNKFEPCIEVTITEMQDYKQWKDTITTQNKLF